MANYSFGLVKYDILDTRSRGEDTNYVTAALSMNGQPIGVPKVKFMGNQNNGSFPLGFTWPDVNVPPGGEVTLLYQILNSGHQNPAQLEKALSDVARQELPAQIPNSWTEELAKTFLKHSIKLLFPNCDGPIAPPEGRRIVWHDFELKKVAPGQTSEDKIQERGNDSPSGCGKNSHYVVHVSVSAA